MIPGAKGAFVATESSLWCCCLRDQQCRAPLTWTFWNPVILGICFVLVLGKGSELPPNQRQIALVGQGWTKAPLAPAQLQIRLFYITEGKLWEALLWFGVLTLSSLTPFCPAGVAVYRKKAVALRCKGSWGGSHLEDEEKWFFSKSGCYLCVRVEECSYPSAQEVLARSHGLLSLAICTVLAGLTVHPHFVWSLIMTPPYTFLEGLIHSPDMRNQAYSESWPGHSM